MVKRARYFISEHVWPHRTRRGLAGEGIGNLESAAQMREMRAALLHLHEVSGVFPGVLS